MSEVSYQGHLFDKDDGFADCSDDFTCEADALAWSKKYVADDGHAVVKRITTVELLRVERSKKQIITKLT